jgi:hypothetical protein
MPTRRVFPPQIAQWVSANEPVSNGHPGFFSGGIRMSDFIARLCTPGGR